MLADRAKKIFPTYFANFTLPVQAEEQEIKGIYRACKTRKLERESFLDTYEENGFKNSLDKSPDDPQEYSLSTFIRLQDVKRFVVVDSRYQPPWVLAKGHTTCEDGKSCKTKDWKDGYRGSHVDWWLYAGAMPWLVFEEVAYEDEYRRLYRKNPPTPSVAL